MPHNNPVDEHVDLEQSALDAFKALSLANARNEKLKEKLKIRNELERRLKDLQASKDKLSRTFITQDQ